MTFQPIGDIADVTLTEQEVLEISWDNAIDFEVANRFNARVSNGSVEISEHLNDFEFGMDNWDTLRNTRISNQKSYSGTQSMYTDYWGLANDLAFSKYLVNPGGHQPEKIIYYYNEFSETSGGQGFRFVNSNGNYELGVASENPEHDIDDANGYNLVHDPGETYEVWRKVEITFDWTAGTFDVSWSIEDNAPYYTATDRPLKIGKDIEYIELWNTESTSSTWFTQAEAEHFVDDFIIDPAPNAIVETLTKTFSEPIKPTIKNLSYSLNGGNIQVSVCGSPDTENEETNSFELTTQTNQDLDWDNPHEVFKLKIKLETENQQRPSFSGLTLSKPDILEDISYEKTLQEGNSFTASVNVTNNTTTSESFDVSLVLGGGFSTAETLTKTTASLGEGQSDTLTWIINGDVAGDASIQADLSGNTSGSQKSIKVNSRIYSSSNTITWETFDWENLAASTNNYYEYSDGTVTSFNKNKQTTIKTSTKSFSTQIKPDLVQMNYDNKNIDITATIVGSPGTLSEELISTTLVGNSSETLSWANAHSDFYIKLEFSGINGKAPEISSIGLGSATSKESILWNTTEDWDNGLKEFNVSHISDALNATPAFRTEFSVNTATNNGVTSNIYHNYWTAQRTFWGDIRVTPLSGGNFNTAGAVEFGKTVGPNSWDLREVAEKNGEPTLTLTDIHMDKGVEYYLGETYPNHYNSGGLFEDGGTDNGDVMGYFYHDSFDWYEWTNIGGRPNTDNSNYHGFSKIEYKEAYYASGYKYTTSPIKPNLTDFNYDCNGDLMKVTVIGSPERAEEESYTVEVAGENTKPINWTNAHKKFQVIFHILKSDTTISSIGLSEVDPPTSVSVDDERTNEVDLSWSNPQSYSEIRIYQTETQSKDISNYTNIQTLTGSATSYTVTGLTKWEEYYFYIVGVESDGTLAASDYITAVAKPSNAIGWHSGTDWDSAQDEEGIGRNQKFKDLLKAEPELADYNEQHLEYWFPFDGDTRDYSGNNFHASICRPDVQFSEGKIGQAIELTAANDDTDVPINHYLDQSPALTACTFSAWVYNMQDGKAGDDGQDHYDILSYDASEYIRWFVNAGFGGDAGPAYGWGIWAEGSNGSNRNITTGEMLNDGKWHNVVVSYDRYRADDDTTILFTDGERSSSADYWRDIGIGIGSKRYAIIGGNTEGSTWNNDSNGSSEYYKGKVDDLRFYRGIGMDENEVKKLYEYGKRGLYHTTNIKTTPTDSQLQ